MALGRVSPFSRLPNLGDLDNQLKTTKPPTRADDPLTTSEFDPRGESIGGGDATGGEGLTSGISGFSGPIASMGLGTLAAAGAPFGMGLGAGVGALGGLAGNAAGGPLGGAVGSLLGSLLGSQAQGRAIGAISGMGDSLVANNPTEGLVNAPVTFTGNQGSLGNSGARGALGNFLGSLGQVMGMPSLFGQTPPSFAIPGTTPFALANQATTDLATGPPDMGGLFTGNQGFATPEGMATGVSPGFTGSGAGGRYGWNAPGVKNPFAPYFFDPKAPRPNPPDPDPTPAPADASPSSGVPGTGGGGQGPTSGGSMGLGGLGGLSFGTGPVSTAPFGEYTEGQLAAIAAMMADEAAAAGQAAAGPPGVVSGIGEATGLPDGIGFGDGVDGGLGDSGGNTGTGSDAGTVGDSGVTGGDYHRGGFVGLEPTMYRGQDAPGRERTIKAETGEFVVNKNAASKFAPLLKGLNSIGREATKGLEYSLPFIIQQLLK